MRVSFKNSPLKIFLVAASSLLAFSLTVGLVNGIYLSTKKNGESLPKLEFGHQVTIQDFMKEQNISSPWIKDGSFLLETNMKTESNKRENVEGVVSLNKKTNTLEFVGVGEGTLNFYSLIDKSVSYSLDFKTSFRNPSMMDVINKQYPTYLEDHVLDKNEINKIEDLLVEDYETFDGSDFAYFPNLKSISIKGNKVTKVLNCSLKENAKIYVEKEKYEDYLATELLVKYRDNIFPIKASNTTSQVVLHKNGGTLFDSWDKDFDCVEIETGQSFINLPSSNEIYLYGNTFLGWFDKDNNQYTIETPINDDIKLYAKWSLDTYLVNYHIDSTVITDAYHFEDDLVIKNLGTEYDNENRKFIGWSLSNDASSVEFDPGTTYEKYFDGVKTGFDLYAVFAHKKVQVKIINKSATHMDSQISYGNSFHLKYEGAEPAGEGKFAGYSLDEDAKSKDYVDDEVLHLEYDPEHKDDIQYLYVTTSKEAVIKFYCVFDPTASFTIFYKVTNANEVSRTYSQNYRIDGDDTSGILIPGYPVTFKDPESFYQDETENIDKVGKHFVGWVREVGGNKTLFTNYSSVSGFSGTIIKTTNYVYADGFSAYENVELKPYYLTNIIHIRYDATSASSAFSNQDLNYGDSLVHSGTYSRTGYNFDAFEITANNRSISVMSKKESMTSAVMANLYTQAMSKYGYTRHTDADGMTILFKPLWNINKYTISFNSNGGTGVNSQTVSHGGKVSKPDDPTHSDYNFEYWYLDNADIAYNFDLAVTSSFTLTAKWSSGCVIEGTLITMADGSKQKVEKLSLGDEILTWNFFTGSYASEPIAFIKKENNRERSLVLSFDNGEEITIVDKHSFFDYSRKEFVTLTMNSYEQYIGDNFFFEDEVSTLVDAHLDIYEGNFYVVMTPFEGNSFANGALNTISEYAPFSKIASINDDMRFDQDELQSNIETFGYANYSDYQEYFSEELFYAFGGQYLNIMFGLNVIDVKTLEIIAKQYNEYGGSL